MRQSQRSVAVTQFQRSGQSSQDVPFRQPRTKPRAAALSGLAVVRPVAAFARAWHGWVMKTLGLVVVFVPLLLGASTAIASPASRACDVQHVKTVGELQTILSLRAVEIVNRGASIRGGIDVRLQRMVAPSAIFSLGSGDVGRPLGVGVAGARALAKEMKADTFRFLGWDYIPTPVKDACASQKVDVEFTDTHGRRVYPITFTFKAGRLIAAAGWSRSFETGPVEHVRD